MISYYTFVSINFEKYTCKSYYNIVKVTIISIITKKI